MFYILVSFGITLIILGAFNDKNRIADSIGSRQSDPIDIRELNELKLRIENLEDILFYIDEDVAIPIAEIPKEENNKFTNSLETFNMLCQYEKENYTLEEICELLGMKKGEVLLLKNLYKNY